MLVAARHLLDNDSVSASKGNGSIQQGLSGFHKAGIFYIVFTAVNIIIFVLDLVAPQIVTLLEASRSTPWGVVTSIFVHVAPSHLVTNLVGLASFFLIFAFTNLHLSFAEKVQRTNFFLLAVAGSAILANLLWITVTDLGSIGASGLIYASEGSVAGFSLINIWKLLDKNRRRGSIEMWSFVLNLVILAALAIWMVISLSSFLGYERDVNVLIHGSSFVSALVISLESVNIRLPHR